MTSEVNSIHSIQVLKRKLCEDELKGGRNMEGRRFVNWLVQGGDKKKIKKASALHGGQKKRSKLHGGQKKRSTLHGGQKKRSKLHGGDTCPPQCKANYNNVSHNAGDGNCAYATIAAFKLIQAKTNTDISDIFASYNHTLNYTQKGAADQPAQIKTYRTQLADFYKELVENKQQDTPQECWKEGGSSQGLSLNQVVERFCMAGATASDFTQPGPLGLPPNMFENKKGLFVHHYIWCTESGHNIVPTPTKTKDQPFVYNTKSVFWATEYDVRALAWLNDFQLCMYKTNIVRDPSKTPIKTMINGMVSEVYPETKDAHGNTIHKLESCTFTAETRQNPVAKINIRVWSGSHFAALYMLNQGKKVYLEAPTQAPTQLAQNLPSSGGGGSKEEVPTPIKQPTPKQSPTSQDLDEDVPSLHTAPVPTVQTTPITTVGKHYTWEQIGNTVKARVDVAFVPVASYFLN
jgi:hypothetical protein